MYAEQYLETVEEQIKSVFGQIDSIRKAADMITNAVLNELKVYVTDKYGIVDNDLVERASGLVLFRSIKTSRNPLQAGDILIISAYHSDDEVDLQTLEQAKSVGAKVITISPNGKLADLSDIALDNKDNGRNGIISVAGIGRPFCPTSGIINSTLAWSVVAEVAVLLLNEEKTPSVISGAHLKDATELNIESHKGYLSLGY